jgi:nucleoside-diphosphate-sugar epimerase
MSLFSVFGAAGGVGARCVATWRAAGHEVKAFRRGEWPEPGEALGHAIYTIGITSDFRTRPLEVADAHAGLIAKLIAHDAFDSLTYLSSTRIYRNGSSGDERATFTIDPRQPDQLYDISKLLGEALMHYRPDPRLKIARLSNVYFAEDRSGNFLPSVLMEAKATGRVKLGQSLRSCKDYIAMDDLVAALGNIAQFGRERIYTIASGRNITHGEIADRLARDFGIGFDLAATAPDAIQPTLSPALYASEFPWQPRHMLDDLPTLYKALT